MTGFTFWIPMNGGIDYFVETKRKKRTDALCREIADVLKWLMSDSEISYFKKLLSAATCEIRENSAGRKYYEICGEDFGGRGSWLDDGKTVIIHLD